MPAPKPLAGNHHALTRAVTITETRFSVSSVTAQAWLGRDDDVLGVAQLGIGSAVATSVAGNSQSVQIARIAPRTFSILHGRDVAPPEPGARPSPRKLDSERGAERTSAQHRHGRGRRQRRGKRMQQQRSQS